MDSINFFKGYGKVSPLEDQSTNQSKAKKKLLITVVISLITLLTLIICATIGALVHESNTESSSSPISTNSAESIRAVCSVTQYPDSCFTSISSFTSNDSSKIDPEKIFNLSLEIAIEELTNLSSLPTKFISKSNDKRTESALKDCASLLDDSLSQLKRSASEMEVGPGEKVLTEAKIGDMMTWISAAMTDQDTCLDGLEEMGSTVLDEVRTKVQKSKEYMSNSLAILSNIKAILDKFDLSLH